MRLLRDLERELPMSADNGLDSAAVAQSRQAFGDNQLTPLPRTPLWLKFLEKFDEPIIKVLLAAALLSIVVDLFRPPVHATRYLVGALAVGVAALAIAAACALRRVHWVPALLFLVALFVWPIGLVTGHPSYDSLAVIVAIVLATAVAFLSEYRSDREFEILNAARESLRAKVVRGGDFHTVAIEELVVGDTVLLEMGDEVPADGRVIDATELSIDQSLMTGESEAVAKHPAAADAAGDGPDQTDCLYRGTQVTEGAGRMIVTEVGDATYLGQIAQRLSAAAAVDNQHDMAEAQRIEHKLTITKELTPLQQKLKRLARLISRVGYTAAVAIFLALLIRGAVTGEVRWPATGEDLLPVIVGDVSYLLGYFMYMVIIIVVAVPEGLPMSVTVSLALAMRKMTRANSLVRQLAACETVGSTTIICTDKTGTLTQNKMQVVRLVCDGQVIDRASADWPRTRQDWQPGGDAPLDWIILNAALNSTAHLESTSGKELIPVGSSTEGALLVWLQEFGIDCEKLRRQFPPLYQLHFSSKRKRMITVVGQGQRLVVLAKGAPEWLLEDCRLYHAADGTRPLTDETRNMVQLQLREAASQAMRTLAFAYAILPADMPADEGSLHERSEQLDDALIYAGFVAIRDPLRPDVKAALADCRAAGIDVLMVTGDNPLTARAIALEVGLLDAPQDLLLTSAEYNALSDADLKRQLPQLRVLARAQPLDKLRLVTLLQELGEVVAVTGDGTNDAPALKRADVGLAMGRAGTEVAKAASKIVLLDDSFATIVKAVHWGRALYENIQRFLQFQLTINVSALAIAFLGPFLGVKPPFTILQLLWINVIMDTLASVALCSEPPRPGLLQVPPKRRDDDILTRSMRGTIAATAVFFVVVMIALLILMESPYRWLAGTGLPSQEFPELTTRQVSIFFTVYVLFQVWNEVNCRSLVPEVSGLDGLTRNPIFLSVLGAIVLGQVAIVTFGGTTFKVEPLHLADWLAIIGSTASVLVFAEIVRRLRKIWGRA
jgi:Ca2+-transporting ATPase